MNARASVLYTTKLFLWICGLVAAAVFDSPVVRQVRRARRHRIRPPSKSESDLRRPRSSAGPDLIPNLVATVKGAANYEQTTLDKITQDRAAATSIKLSADDLTDPAKMQAYQDAQNKISSSAISRLLVANENYPKLQASGQYSDLMKQLEGTENRILRAREEYNAAVRLYNAELLKISWERSSTRPPASRSRRASISARPPESQVAPKVSF